jgi:glycosyltransferase involved in cell wall biosynthesis
MRILVLLTDAFGGHGGIAQFNRNLLAALCLYGGCTEVMAMPRLISADMGRLPEKLNYLTEGIGGKVNYLRTAFSLIKKGGKFDLIICGHINLLPVAYLFRLWFNIPILLVIHGIDAWNPTHSHLVNFLVNKIDYFISVSNFTKRRFLGWAKINVNKGFLLPNAIHPELYLPGPKSPFLLKRYGLDNKKVIMTLGRLSPHERFKGFDEVMEVIPELMREVPDIIYLIGGDGPDRKRLEEKARNLGLENRIIFTGFVHEEEKAGHYRLADVYVMPSRGEGFGIVFLEAMACGIPVIASKVDGSCEAVLNGQIGILVDPSNAREIKEGILEGLKRPRGTVPEQLEYFSFNNFKLRLHHIIDQIYSERIGSCRSMISGL